MMTHALPLTISDALPANITAETEHGLPREINQIAQMGPATHAFLRRQWFAAALAGDATRARTVVVRAGDVPLLALPLAPIGPRPLALYSIPGSYWPFRGFSAVSTAPEVLTAALDTLCRSTRALRIGPVYENDAIVSPLIEAAHVAGWGVASRRIGSSFMLDMEAQQMGGSWPRSSTLKKNRFHEKHLSTHGALAWRFLSGADWPGAFDDLAAVERASWIDTRTDGSDAKFTATGHGAFWRAAAADPVLAAMFRAALLTIDGRPAAFSFDIDAGALKYAIANSYDPTFAKHSPGKLLYWRNLVEALDRGITHVDWGMGDSGYKRVIGANEGPAVRDYLLLRPGFIARAAGSLGFLGFHREPA